MERLREVGCEIYFTMYGGQITLALDEMSGEREKEEEQQEKKGKVFEANTRSNDGS